MATSSHWLDSAGCQSLLWSCAVTTSAVSEIMSSSSDSEDCTRRGFGIFGQSFYQAEDETSEAEAARPGVSLAAATSAASAGQAQRTSAVSAVRAKATSATSARQDNPFTPRKEPVRRRAPTPASSEKTMEERTSKRSCTQQPPSGSTEARSRARSYGDSRT